MDISIPDFENAVETETWQLTSELRFLHDANNSGPIYRLQQLWWCRENGKRDWRDVETVER